MTPSFQNAAGPFSVHGEQMQRGIAKHAFHQIHSAHGKTAEPRCFSSCCVCARGRWQEDLRSLKLFVTGIKQDAADDFPAHRLSRSSNPLAEICWLFFLIFLFLSDFKTKKIESVSLHQQTFLRFV